MHQAYVNYSGRVKVAFPDILTPTLDADQTAYYIGDLVDVGEDKLGKWIDIRLTSHEIENAESKAAKREIYLEVTESMPEDPSTWTQEQVMKWANAQIMSREVQSILGNLQPLQASDDITRFYMHMIGPSIAVMPIQA